MLLHKLLVKFKVISKALASRNAGNFFGKNSQIVKIFKRNLHKYFIVAITLLGSLFLIVFTLRTHQNRLIMAATIAETPGSYGYGNFGVGIYGGTSSPSAFPSEIPTPSASPTAILTPTPTPSNTPTPTSTPTPIPPTSTPKPTATPTPTPTSTPTPKPTATPTPKPSPTNTPSPTPATGNGLKAVYYNNNNFTGTTLSRIDSTVNFNWGTGSPDKSIASDTFSAVWTGYVIPKYSQTYTFYTNTDDGVRLWVNGVQLVNKWKDQGATEYSGKITLAAGIKYIIKMEYYDNLRNAVAQLSWSSSSQAKQIIPKSQLYTN